MLSFRLSVYTFSSKFVNADGRIRTSGPVTAGLLLSGEPHSTTLPHLLIVGPCHHGPPGTSLLTVLMRRVGFEPTMFTTWVTVLQTACFSHLHTGAYGGRPGRPPFSYVSTIAYGPGQICIIFKLTRHSHSCTPLSLYTVNPAPRPALPAAPARLYRR